MTNIIQFPRPNPRRRWSPDEILAIQDSTSSQEIERCQRAGIVATAAKADEAAKRQKKTKAAKQRIVEILDSGVKLSVHELTYQVQNWVGTIARNTVSEYLRELATEGRVHKVGSFWVSTQGLEK